MSKDKVRHSKYFVLSPEEVRIMLNHSVGRDNFVIASLTFGGIREGELVHMQNNWIHINDKAAEKFKVNHITIPAMGNICDCDDCTRQAYFEFMRGKTKRTSNWYPKMQKKYYALKQADDLPDLGEIRWSPKSESGARIIPILFPEYKTAVQSYFKDNKSVDITRQTVWRIVKRVGKTSFGEERTIYPHVIRATCATLWAGTGMDPYDLTTLMGWKSIKSAEPYIQADVKKMITTVKSKKDLWMK